MGTFLQQSTLAKRATSQAISKELFDFIRTVSAYLVQLNREQIKTDSQDIYGKAIGFYSKATDEISGGKKEWGTPFTGDDTGEWLSKFYVTVRDNVFYFGSSDPKTDDILESKHWLSHDLFGLTDENLEKVIEEKFLPFVQQHSRELIGL